MHGPPAFGSVKCDSHCAAGRVRIERGEDPVNIGLLLSGLCLNKDG